MVSQTQQFEIQRAPNPPSLPNTAFFFIRNILVMLFWDPSEQMEKAEDVEECISLGCSFR